MRKTKFDFNRNTMTVFQKFVAFLNEVTDEVKAVEDIVKEDDTDSGEVRLKYAYDDDKFYEVDAEGFVYGINSEKLKDGEFALLDGSVLVVKDGKFDGTIMKEDAKNTEDKVEEAPISQDEENPDEEEKEEEKTVEQEDGDDEEKKPEEEEEKSVEQDGEAVPFTINGVEYLLPVEVVAYINSLSSTSETFRKEIAQIRQRTPSVKPTTTAPVKQSKESVGNLYDRVNMFRTR